jgi:hypothetical protein
LQLCYLCQQGSQLGSWQIDLSELFLYIYPHLSISIRYYPSLEVRKPSPQLVTLTTTNFSNTKQSSIQNVFHDKSISFSHRRCSLHRHVCLRPLHPPRF